MKVYIGKYKNYFGCYQLAELLHYIGFSEKFCNKLAAYLSKTFLGKFFDFIYKNTKRKISVKIDSYDTWSMDSTLSLIILPMLKQLQETKMGAPIVEDQDVPDHLKSTHCKPKAAEYDVDENHFKRWDWVLAEMIWCFEQLQPDYDWQEQYCSGVLDFVDIKTEFGIKLEYGPNYTYKRDEELIKKHHQRITNGLRLFGKYYECLWD